MSDEYQHDQLEVVEEKAEQGISPEAQLFGHLVLSGVPTDCA